MSDYSDIIYVSVAMVVFALLTVNTSRSFLFTSDTLIRSDLEYRAISLAQDEIDNIRWLEGPEEEYLDPSDSDYLYKNDPISKTLSYGESGAYTETFTIDRSSTKISDDSFGNDRYLIRVEVQSNALNPEITGTLEFIKTFEN